MRLYAYIMTTTDGQKVRVVASNIVAAHRAMRENGMEPAPGGTRLDRVN